MIEIDLPTYELKLPSSGEPITIRPFTVKEEKLLLTALESNSDEEIINTTKQIVNNCIVSDPLDLDKIPFFDVDYIFIALRAKSIGDTVDLKFKCEASFNDTKCGAVFPVKLDIANVEVKKNGSISETIQITKDVSVKMKYPSYKTVKSILDNDTIINKKINLIVGSIYYIVKNEQIFKAVDTPQRDLVAFVENLTQEQFRKLENFVNNFPTFVVTADSTCPQCGFEHHIEYKDFTSFFV